MAGLLASLGGRLWSILLVVVLASLVSAQDDIAVFTSANKEVPDWARPNALELQLTSQPRGLSPVKFTVIPLTASLGLNGTGEVRGVRSLVCLKWTEFTAN